MSYSELFRLITLICIQTFLSRITKIVILLYLISILNISAKFTRNNAQLTISNKDTKKIKASQIIG